MGSLPRESAQHISGKGNEEDEVDFVKLIGNEMASAFLVEM